MTFDIEQHFNKMKADPKWLTKFAIGGSFYFLVLIFQFLNNLSGEGVSYLSKHAPEQNLFMILFLGLLSLVFLGGTILVSAVPTGYVTKFIHEDLKNGEHALPEWIGNFPEYMKKGLLTIAINYIYSAIFFVLGSVPSIITVFVCLTHKDSQPIIISSVLTLSLFIIALIIIHSIVSPFAVILYAENFRFKDAFNFGKILDILKSRISDITKVILALILFYILYVIAIILISCTLIGILFLPFLSMPVALIIYCLFIEIYKNYKFNSVVNIENI